MASKKNKTIAKSNEGTPKSSSTTKKQQNVANNSKPLAPKQNGISKNNKNNNKQQANSGKNNKTPFKHPKKEKHVQAYFTMNAEQTKRIATDLSLLKVGKCAEYVAMFSRLMAVTGQGEGDKQKRQKLDKEIKEFDKKNGGRDVKKMMKGEGK